MFGPAQEERRPSLLSYTLKTAAVVGALSFMAAGWLSAATDNQTLARLAMNASRGIPDPLTTGSIANRANQTRIDPCNAPGARR